MTRLLLLLDRVWVFGYFHTTTTTPLLLLVEDPVWVDRGAGTHHLIRDMVQRAVLRGLWKRAKGEKRWWEKNLVADFRVLPWTDRPPRADAQLSKAGCCFCKKNNRNIFTHIEQYGFCKNLHNFDREVVPVNVFYVLTNNWVWTHAIKLLIRGPLRFWKVSPTAENYHPRSHSGTAGWVADNQTLFSQINKNKIHNKLQNNISYLGA